MKLILQSKNSSAFIEDLDGSWTKESGRAHGFANGLEALLFCFSQRMSRMQMVATFRDAAISFSVPVADVRGE